VKVVIRQEHKEQCYAYLYTAHNSVLNFAIKGYEHHLFQTGEQPNSTDEPRVTIIPSNALWAKKMFWAKKIQSVMG